MWSAKSGPDVALVFRQTFLLKGVCHEEEAVFSRADCGCAQASGDGDAGGRSDPALKLVRRAQPGQGGLTGRPGKKFPGLR